ncbi:MraY family glycosyltransferase [Luteibaculum oceani]|uniref:MraY family glycosyltransferase n=1 Tax=Luteibaculum oceani TaxID=1294296 RepID=UPI001476ED7E|nr:MraY family glycosyltransferase [Luteibaculum oceani]
MATPVVIKVAKIKHLVDVPDRKRKVHVYSTPTIGGVSIFACFLITFCLFAPVTDVNTGNEFRYLICCLLILFYVGLKDDITGLSALKKLIAHLIVGYILVYLADIRIVSMGGIFGLHQLPDIVSYSLSIFTYIVIINSMNLIDGIDGLAAGIGCLASLFFAFYFYQCGDLFWTTLAISLAGALSGFLVFNFSPAKIFMGDSGSLVIGFVLAILAMKLINYPTQPDWEFLRPVSKPVLAMSILSYPLIDTLRVFAIRALNGVSPFSPDKNHVHHILIDDNKRRHGPVAVILYGYCIAVILLNLVWDQLPVTWYFVAMLFSAALLLQALVWIKRLR